MKVKSEFLIAKTEVKTREDKTQYLMLSILDLGSGDVFDIVHKNIEDYAKLKPMTKVDLEVDISNSKYGLKLAIVEIGETLGAI